MLSRGFYDVLAPWPAMVWPLVFSSLFFALVRICQISSKGAGAAPLDTKHVPDAVLVYLFFPMATMFEVCAHIYFFWVVGWVYLPIVIPIYILGWILLPATLDSVPTVQFVLPVLYVLSAAAALVLLGFADIALLKAANAQFYALLTGVPGPF